jgi:hypothetical protein
VADARPLPQRARSQAPPALRTRRLAKTVEMCLSGPEVRALTRVRAPSRVSIPAFAEDAGWLRRGKHDQSTHRRRAAQPLHRRRFVCRPGGLGLVGGHRDSDRRDPGSLGQPGDRLHRLAGAQPAGGRGPGHVSADHQPAGTCGRPGGSGRSRHSASR